jgi:hypothetical protein
MIESPMARIPAPAGRVATPGDFLPDAPAFPIVVEVLEDLPECPVGVVDEGPVGTIELIWGPELEVEATKPKRPSRHMTPFATAIDAVVQPTGLRRGRGRLQPSV